MKCAREECGREVPPKSRPGGRPKQFCSRVCKERKRGRRRYIANVASYRARNRKWRKANPDKWCEYTARWRKANPEKVKAASKKYRDAYPYTVRFSQLRYYTKNHAMIIAKSVRRTWLKRNLHSPSA